MNRAAIATMVVMSLSANVLIASPSPLHLEKLRVNTSCTDECAAAEQDMSIKRLGGRKRRTPADFVRQFEA